MSDVTVVCGIIEYKDKILIGKKVECDHPINLGGKWHLPGGRVEKGEILETALKREIKEETNIEIEIKEKLGYNFQTSKTGRTVRIIYFKCTTKTHNVIAFDDMQELRWVDKQDVLNKLDKQFIKMLPKKVISFFEMSY